MVELVVQTLVPVAGDLRDLRWLGQARTDVAAAWYCVITPGETVAVSWPSSLPARTQLWQPMTGKCDPKPLTV
ncbi:hypothetical protein amrb99_12450 [Actinomadura sp. RB99]|nr:hypothetical protein [Actinomadura sp. RB99]